MYKKAAQDKVRFYTDRGVIAVEDLFDLNYTQLNKIYQSLRKQQGDAEDSLIAAESTPEDAELNLKVALVKDVYDTKKEAADARKAAADKKAQKARIMEIIASKQDAALADKSLDELTAMLNDL